MGKKHLTFEKKVYILGWIFIPLGLWFIAVFDKLFLWMHNIKFKCYIFEKTGYYCPGCGGTRAINYMLHGDFIKSFIYHPFVLIALAMYIIYMISHTISLFKKDYDGIEVKTWHAILLLIVVLANWIMKNILLHFGVFAL